VTIHWHTLRFPAGVEAESVADILRTLGGESRGGLFARRTPVVIETELNRREVSWRIGATRTATSRLKHAAEQRLSGLSWTATDESASFNPTVAVEVRVVGLDRLLATDFAEAAAQRLLGTAHELRSDESLLIQWQIGPWLGRSPIRPASTKRPERNLWNIEEWGVPDLDSEQVTAARKKAAEHIFACVGRIAVRGAEGERAHQLLAAAGGALQLLRAPGVGVSRRAIPSWVAKRRLHTYRVPPIGPPCRLTATELAGLIGWPLGNPRLPGVSYVASRALPLDDRVLIPAAIAEPTDRIVGESAYPSQADQVAVLRPAESLRHLHVIGPSGVGKSTLLAHLILADLVAGRSVVAVDPKGDLVTDILTRLPRDQRERVVVLDPSDPAPVGFNPLDGGAVGIDGVLHVLRSVWSDSWGPRLNDVLHAGLLTLAASPGHTLAELPLLLGEPSFRRPLVARAVKSDPLGLGTFWPWYDGLSPEMRAQVLGPVMSRMRALLLRPDLRAVLAQPEPRFDPRSIFTNRMALLVRLPKGQLGSEGAQLLGSLLVAHLWRLSQSRAAISVERRHPVSLVLDEFQEFLRLPLDLPDALVQARGLGVGLTLAHQHLGQLDSAVKAAVLANAGSRVVFHTDFDDAGTLAKRSAGRVTAEDLMGLEPFHAYASLLAGDAITAYGSLRTRPLAPRTAHGEQALRRNREQFGIARAVTEKRLTDLLGGTPSGPTGPTPESLGGRRVNGGPP
jgi:hypothetical protein